MLQRQSTSALLRAIGRNTTLTTTVSRGFRSSAPRLETPAHVLPARKPVGAFRGGLIGFLLGTSIGAYGSYYFLFADYTKSNDLLTEDLYALQAAVTRLHTYVTSLEEKIDKLGRR